MKPKIIIGVLIIVGALAYLIFGGFTSSAVYYLSIPELQAKENITPGEGLRITGYVDTTSIAWNAEKIELRFTLFEEQDSVSVFYSGIMPDQMKDAQQVVAEGHVDESGQFVATKLLLKCPSKYETE